MPQFAIHRNPGRNPEIVFVVQLQSTRLDRALGRLVMPLVERRAGCPEDHPLTPHLMVQGRKLYANPFDLAAVPVSRLGPQLATLSEADQDKIVRALDELISRA